MEKVDSYQLIDPNDKTVSTLRAFYTYLPGNGRVNFLRHLQSLETNQQVHDHARSLINGLVAPLRWLRSTPSICPHLGMEDSIKNVNLKIQCLSRDGSRCVVTGLFDHDSRDPSSTSRSTFTECVHIIPFSLASWRTEADSYAKDIIWTNLVRYFPTIRSINFNQENINDPTNAITININLQKAFTEFYFAFEETPRPHRYRIQNYCPQLDLRLPRAIAFTSFDQRYPLPSPELLKVHAIIARIFHASGAAEVISKGIRDPREHDMLAKDGSTDISPCWP